MLHRSHRFDSCLFTMADRNQEMEAMLNGIGHSDAIAPSGSGHSNSDMNGFAALASDSSNSIGEPWPPLDQQQIIRSSSRSSNHSVNSGYNPTDIFFFEDGNMVVNKPGSNNKIPSGVPRVNVPERIIICIDLSTDADYTPYLFGDGTKSSPLTMVKRVVQVFLHSKQAMNSSHQYALIVLHDDQVAWLQGFTSDVDEILSIVTNLSENREQPSSFDLCGLFDTIYDEVALPIEEDSLKNTPPFIVRTVLLYSRSDCIPTFTGDKTSFDCISSSPYFFMDLLYIHEPVNGNKKVEKIYTELCAVSNESSYVYNVARNPTKLHDCMAKLLAHPLQRPRQEDADYKLILAEDS